MAPRVDRTAPEQTDVAAAAHATGTRRRTSEHGAPPVAALAALDVAHRASGSAPPRASDVLALQRRVGNRAAARLLGIDGVGGTAEVGAERATAQRRPLVRRNGEEEKAAEAAEEAAEAEPADEAPANANFTPGQILFASMSGNAVGSIYFPNGRIRLAHGSGPEVSIIPDIERYTISEEDYQANWGRRRGMGSADFKALILALDSCAAAAVGAAGRLVEFWNGGRHPSRGGPRAFNYALTQRQLNIIYNAALSGDNDTLRAAMAADDLLATIPLAP